MKQPSERPRVVITGTGVATPIGIGTRVFWQNALAGKNGLKEIQNFDTSDLRTHKGGEILDFNAKEYLSADEIGTMGRASHLAVASARMALEEAGLSKAISRYRPERRAISFGTTMGEPDVLDGVSQGIVEHGLEGFSESLIFTVPSSRIPNNIGRIFDFRGPNYQIPTACAAGNYAIGYARDLLRMNRVDVVIAGGSDAFSRIAFAGFNKLLATASNLCRPFDKNREGMMVAEGSACLVLERLDDALERGAPIIAEVLDYGIGCDAYKMTIPHPEGRGGIIAMQQALAKSGLSIDDVDVICAHGTGTKENDKVETQIIKDVFGDKAYRLKVHSLKSMIGHTMGAASAIEAVASALEVKEDRIPPTINYTEPDPECDLDYVPNTAIQHRTRVVVSNAYAFGGNASSLVIAKYQN